MNTPLLIGNWKMNKLSSEVGKFCEDFRLKSVSGSRVHCMIAPSFLSLRDAVNCSAAAGLQVAAQNVHFEKSGAFTGEISIPMLKEISVFTSIVGHSERRQLFGEGDESVARKAQALTSDGMLAVACVGETKDERQSEKTFEVMKRQCAAILEAVATHAKLVIAYEPVWAIGTGLNASPDQAQEVHAFIRKMLQQRYGETDGTKIRILYGGSVKSSNIAGLISQRDIDGALVGGSSLDPTEFAMIGNTVADCIK